MFKRFRKVKCPYCNQALDEAPKRKKKCPHCGEPIHVKRRVKDNKKVFVTAKEAKKIDLDWNDKKWGDLHKDLDKAANMKAFDQIRIIYHDMASIVAEERGEFQPLLIESARAALRDFQEIEEYVKKVIIENYGPGAVNCEECKKLDGKEMTLEEAIRTMPIPNDKCTHELYEGNPGWCKCSYKPVIEI